jgi:hypothetical protein
MCTRGWMSQNLPGSAFLQMWVSEDLRDIKHRRRRHSGFLKNMKCLIGFTF